MHYLYDGSFEGLLTCIYYNYYGEKASGIYRQDSYQPVLMIDSTEVITEPALAARVYQAIEKISGDALENVYHAFVSSAPDKEILILNYLRLAFGWGAKLMLTIPIRMFTLCIRWPGKLPPKPIAFWDCCALPIPAISSTRFWLPIIIFCP